MSKINKEVDNLLSNVGIVSQEMMFYMDSGETMHDDADCARLVANVADIHTSVILVLSNAARPDVDLCTDKLEKLLEEYQRMTATKDALLVFWAVNMTKAELEEDK